MGGFEWSPPAPHVPMEPGEDGWCIRDAVCEMYRWKSFSPEWSRFIEWPQSRDVARLAGHLGLAMLESPQNWNDLIVRAAHPGIAFFDFPARGKSHAIYVYDVAALIQHWPTAEGPPTTDWLFWYGWPLHREHLEQEPVLGAVLLDECQPPHDL
jgi:hypothetical protein